MRSVQTQSRFPLSAVKPFDRLVEYRKACLSRTRQAFSGPVAQRARCPEGHASLEPFGEVEGIAYMRCAETGSFSLAGFPDWEKWASLLEEMGRYRQSPEAFHSGLTQSRAENVYLPKLEWIEESLRLQGIRSATVLEVSSPPMAFGEFLKARGSFAEVIPVNEMRLAHLREVPPDLKNRKAQAALLLESLDRVDDPGALLKAAGSHVAEGGLLFVTALVASGFDIAVLGLRNLYLCPPDRANCFTLQGLKGLLEQHGFELIEVSTPGVLDLEIVASHLKADPSIPLTVFERQLIASGPETRSAFQAFLQENGLSSFARLVGKKKG